MAKTELTPGYYNDPLNGYGGVVERGPFPLDVVDDSDNNLYDEWIASGSFANKTIVTLHGVSAQPVPVRWLGLIVETSQTLELLQAHGVELPTEWKLMAPVHLNAASNNLDPHGGVKQAQNLARLAQEYVARFHPDLSIIPELELDDPKASQELVTRGHEIVYKLPDDVLQNLSSMSGNRHAQPDSDEAVIQAAGYLLGHYNAYGYSNQGGFPNRQHGTIFVLPRSEIKFIEMMTNAQEAVTGAGIPVISREESQTVTLLSPTIRTPHYYPHDREPLLGRIRNVQDWNRSRNLGNHGINGRALDEIREVIALIDRDVTKARIPELVELIKGTL